SYSMRLDHEQFLKELVQSYGRVSGKFIAGKIANSYSEDQWVEVLNAFIKLYPKFRPVCIEMSAMLADKRNESSIDLEQFIKKAPSYELIALASDFFKISKYKSALFLLEDQDQSNSEVRYVLGNCHYELGQLQKAWFYLSSLIQEKSENVALLTKVILMGENQIIEAHKILELIDKRKKLSARFKRGESKKIAQIEAFSYVSTLQWEKLDLLLKKEKSNFKKSDLQLIFFFKSFFTKEYEDAINLAKSFLYIELKHPYFTKTIDAYEFLLENSENFDQEYFPKLVDLHRMILSNESQGMEVKISQLRTSLESEAIYFKISPLLSYASNQNLRILYEIEQDLAKKDQLIAKWEKSSMEMFEEFPNSHYTSWVIEQLSFYYEKNALLDKQTSLIKSYLLKFPSNLLAQRLRNKLL
ncbi:hypothetical protein MJH12_02615, partial [bacterium]|nr:hypothetical protein [bacterium]